MKRSANDGATNTVVRRCNNGTMSSPLPGGARVVFRVPRMALLAVGMLALGVSAPALAWPIAFSWLWILPLLALYLVLRLRTVVSPEDLRTRTVLSSRTIEWSHVRGIRFPRRPGARGFSRRWGRAVLDDDTEAQLPMVTVDRLSLLAIASGGRVPNPVTTAPSESDESQPDESIDATDADADEIEQTSVAGTSAPSHSSSS